MLHPSLRELGEAARICSSIAQARGILAESHELLTNALAHGESARDLAPWYSRLLSDVLHSPACAPGGTIVLTGPVGRGDGLPTSRVEWLVVAEDPECYTDVASPLLNSVGLVPNPYAADLGPAPLAEWEQRIVRLSAQGADASGRALAALVDAGTWIADELFARGFSPAPLLALAVEHRPEAVRSLAGLPDNSVAADVLTRILIPAGDVARWAGASAGYRETDTAGRIAAGRAAGFLSPVEADYLEQAWETGLSIQFSRWRDHVESHPKSVADLLPVERASFGAAARAVGDVIRSVSARFGVTQSDSACFGDQS